MNADWPLIEIPEGEYDRRKYIGSSNAAAIMSLGATYDGVAQTPYGVYLAKTAAEPEAMDPERRRFLERRKRWEPVVVQHLREDFDAEIVATNRRYRHPHIDYLAAEIDWEWRDVDGTIQNGETKTVYPLSFSEKQGWGEAGTDQIPIHYYIQTQFGLMVTGRQKAAVAALIGVDTLVFYLVERDEEDIARILSTCSVFWNEHVQRGVPPDPQTINDIHRRWGQAKNDLDVEVSSAIGSKAMRLRALSGQLDAIALEWESLEFDLKLEMKDATGLVVGGRRLLSWKNQKWTRLNQTKLKAEFKEAYKACTEKGTQRVFKALKSAPEVDPRAPETEQPPQGGEDVGQT